MSIELKHDHKDVVYYNATLFNPSTGQPVPAYISDTRSQAIINHPNKFECSIVRFDLSADLLPPAVAPMPPFPGGALPADLPSLLRVTLRYLGVDYQTIVLIGVVSADTYGFVYAIDELTRRVNTALATSFAAIPGPSSTAPPQLIFDPKTQLLSLYYQATYVTAGNPIEIWVNSSLYKYMVSIPAAFAGYNNANGRDFRIQVESNSALTIPAVGARAGYPSTIQAVAGEVRQLQQAGPSMNSWNGVRSLFITTSMPINAESLPTNPLLAQNSSYSSNTLPILSDFVLGVDPGTNPVVDRISVAYLPTAEYRMVQMRGNEPLTRVDLKWFYTLFDGTIREVLIPPGGFCSAKIMFRRSTLP